MNYARLRAELGARRLALAAILVALTCLALSLTLRPVPQTAAVAAEASAMDLRISQQLLFEQSIGLKPGGARFGTVATATVNGAAVTSVAAQAALTRLATAAPELDRLVVAPESELSLRSEADGCLSIGVRKGEARVDLIAGADEIVLTISGRGDGGSEFALCAAEPLELAFYGASGIEFRRSFRPNAMQSYSLSSLKAGTVAFPGLGVERRIVPLNGLRLDELGSRAPLIVTASPGGAQLDVRYVGDAASILTGPPGNRRQQMPRLLEHLIGNAPLATMLAGFGFFWGLIWGLVKFSRSSAQA